MRALRIDGWTPMYHRLPTGRPWAYEIHLRSGLLGTVRMNRRGMRLETVYWTAKDAQKKPLEAFGEPKRFRTRAEAVIALAERAGLKAT